ncbi:MAG: hypothetical protein JW771_00315, partial [Candidatus Thermoplasmatota archaeon]|nr:hypothetical protein [Candidatus Thermoplasmatota archaeon]
MDEVRISNVVRNISWINATFQNVNNTSNFLSFGSQETPNSAPSLSNPQPANGATNIAPWPMCNITVSDSNGGTVDVSFYENTTGVWKVQQTNSSVNVDSPATVQWLNYSNASAGSTTYWWSVNASDGEKWTNDSYSFTTSASPFLYVFDGQRYRKVSDFIPGATSPEKEYVHALDITDHVHPINGTITVKITEELDEITYLDTVYLLIDETDVICIETMYPGNRSLLQTSDNEYLVLRKGDGVYLTFTVTKTYSHIMFVSEGHYVEYR